MYPIDFMTCTARDVIERSFTCHPSLFTEKLKGLSKTHLDYSRCTSDRMACESAIKLAGACGKASEATPSEICADFNMRIVAFSVAADLQLVPRSLRGDIIERA